MKEMDQLPPLRIRLLPARAMGNRQSRLEFALLDREHLISRAELMAVTVAQDTQRYNTLGVCAVLTMPAYQRQGYGHRLLRAVTKQISACQVDLGLLFCQPHLAAFYGANGWEACPTAETRIGTPDRYTCYPLLRMMLFVSAEAQQACRKLREQPLYLTSAW